MKQPNGNRAGARRRLLALYYFLIRYLFYSCGHVVYEIVFRTHQNASFSREKKYKKIWGEGALPPQIPLQWGNGASQETRLLS